MLKTRRTIAVAVRTWLPLLVLAVASTAQAQFGPQALFAPGQSIPLAVVQTEGGSAGRALARDLGKRPILIVYWQPKNPQAEAALINAYAALRDGAPHVAFVPIAFLTSGQGPNDVRGALDRLGLPTLQAIEDFGQMARVVGFGRAPSFALIDAAGVLRLVGGTDISQNSPQGTSIFEAVMMAQEGQAVPTLGVMGTRPVYKMLGRKLPELAVTELDGKTWRKANELTAASRKLLLVYWLPSCSHCREALPKLKEWVERTKPQTLDVVDISRGDVESLRVEAAAFVKGYPWNAHFLDVSSNVGKQLMAIETPSAYLVGSDGEIEGIQVGGGIDWGKWLAGIK
jgi:thiol-disulfide isomerase/thioredoxin